jgi:hypothetical protein
LCERSTQQFVEGEAGSGIAGYDGETAGMKRAALFPNSAIFVILPMKGAGFLGPHLPSHERRTCHHSMIVDLGRQLKPGPQERASVLRRRQRLCTFEFAFPHLGAV